MVFAIILTCAFPIILSFALSTSKIPVIHGGFFVF